MFLSIKYNWLINVKKDVIFKKINCIKIVQNDRIVNSKLLNAKKVLKCNGFMRL